MNHPNSASPKPARRRGLEDPGPAAAHIQALARTYTLTSIARAAGLSFHAVRRLANGTATGVTTATATAVLSTTPPHAAAARDEVPAELVVQRLGMLAAAGWPLRWQHDQLGLARRTVYAYRKATVLRRGTFDHVDALFQAYRDRTPGPRDGLTPYQVFRARGWARRNGYYPPFCYRPDDTDPERLMLNPDAIPADVWSKPPSLTDMVPAEETAQLLRAMRAHHKLVDIVEATGLNAKTIRGLCNGTTRTVQRITARAVANARIDDAIPAARGYERLNALAALGWPRSYVLRRLGIAVCGNPWAKTIEPDTFAALDRLFDSLGSRRPDPAIHGIPRNVSARVASLARRAGYHPPAAYNTAADGSLVLAPEAVREETLEERKARRDAAARCRIDVLRLALDGLPTARIAKRLDLHPRAVDRQLRVEAGLSWTFRSEEDRTVMAPRCQARAELLRAAIAEYDTTNEIDAYELLRYLGPMAGRGHRTRPERARDRALARALVVLAAVVARRTTHSAGNAAQVAATVAGADIPWRGGEHEDLAAAS